MSIRDVAAAAGVSTTTVSHAINGKGRVDDATRERILRIADELGYRANRNAVNLVRAQTGVIALTISAPPDDPVSMTALDFFFNFANAATSAAQERGYSVVLIPSANLGALTAIEFDGAIVLDVVSGDPLVEELKRTAIPVVTSGRTIDSVAGFDRWVENDVPGMTALVLDHMREMGAHRIGLIAPEPRTSYGVDLIEAYEDWCAKRDVPATFVNAGHQLTETAGFEAAKGLLAGRDRCDGILAGIDRYALGALLCASALGLRVPEDVLVASAVDSEAMRRADPPITALDIHPEVMGARAATLLIDRIDGDGDGGRRAVVEVDLIARRSTRVADPVEVD
ncbi:MAG: LacI family DNA-binding transcriptional regulator [Solirubrobacterales bacterium]